MKNTYLYLAILIILGTVAYFVLTNKSESTLDSEDGSFAVENTDEIYKIFIANQQRETAMVTRKDNHWEYTNSEGETYKARPAAIEVLLKTIRGVSVRYMVQEAAVPMAIQDLQVNGRKVELYNKEGKRFKTYYVGGPSNDMEGTFMMMENSNNPYVTHLQFLDGFLTDRYLIAERDWRDKTVFGYKSSDIKSLSIDYPKQQSNAFKLTQVREGKFEVEPLYPTTAIIQKPVIDQKALAYLYNYERLIAEAVESKNPNLIGIINRVPFCTITITENSGIQKIVKFIPVLEDVESHEDQTKTRPKIQRYFAFVNGNEDVFLVQHLLFGKVFWGYDFFFES
jgi:hypothetical protein